MAELATVRQAFSRAASRYGEAAGLQRRVGERLLSMLPASGARRVLDLGCGVGFAAAGLLERHPGAELLSVDFSPAMLAAHQCSMSVANTRVCADAHRLPFADACVDLVFSSLMIQWCDLMQALKECRRVLQPGGYLCFSTVLKGSLQEIDLAFSAVDAHRHTLSFHDAEGLGVAIAAAGLRTATFEQDRFIEHFADARGLLQSNRNIGASRVPERGRSSLLGRSALQDVCRRLESMRTPPGIPLTYELAWVLARRPLPAESDQ